MMDAQELLDWQVLEQIDPFGQKRDDLRFAMLASTIVNAQGAKKTDGTTFTAKDFLLNFEEAEPTDEDASPQQSADNMERMFRAAVAANNAFWKRKEQISKVN